jgi:hypothetical protein
MRVLLCSLATLFALAEVHGALRATDYGSPRISLPSNLALLSPSDPRWAELNANGSQFCVKPPGGGGESGSSDILGHPSLLNAQLAHADLKDFVVAVFTRESCALQVLPPRTFT